MTAEQFTLWLQGFAELTPAAPTPEQWTSIREHLATVFTKVTPPLGGYPRDDLRAELREILRPADVGLKRRVSTSRDRIIC